MVEEKNPKLLMLVVRNDSTHRGENPRKVKRPYKQHRLIGHLATSAGCFLLLSQCILLAIDEAEASARTRSISLVWVDVLSKSPCLGLIELHLPVDEKHADCNEKDGTPNDAIVYPSKHKSQLATFTRHIGVVETISGIGGIPAQPSRWVIKRQRQTSNAHGPSNDQGYNMKVGLNLLYPCFRPTIPYYEDVVNTQHAVVHGCGNVASLVKEPLRGACAGGSNRTVHSRRALGYWPSGHDIDNGCHDIKYREGQDEPIVWFRPPTLGPCHILENVGRPKEAHRPRYLGQYGQGLLLGRKRHGERSRQGRQVSALNWLFSTPLLAERGTKCRSQFPSRIYRLLNKGGGKVVVPFVWFLGLISCLCSIAVPYDTRILRIRCLTASHSMDHADDWQKIIFEGINDLRYLKHPESDCSI